jgi:hypothetical protein
MTELLSRADALKNVFVAGVASDAQQGLAEAAIACCCDLVDAGEFAKALDLIESSRQIAGEAGDACRLRLRLVEVRALRLNGHFERSLDLASTVLEGISQTG